MNNSFILNTINTLLNLIDVLCVILPVLLSVAFMTIIERKQLAAHQRRVGPNTTGYSKLNKKDYLKSNRNPRRNFIRFCHNLSNNNKNIIKELYLNRVAPVKLFDSNIIDTCYNLTSIEDKNNFFNKFKGKGGIYLFQYK